MALSRSEIHLYPRKSHFAVPAGMRAAVSLHSHSECSRETLEFIPRIARHLPVVPYFFERGLAAYHSDNGRPIDFGEWYWRPLVTPAGVVDSEQAQLEERLDLPGLVSLTDHDTVQGPLALRTAGRTDVPLSFEWSVPFEGSLFHFGVHAISPPRVDEMMSALGAYTAGPQAAAVRRLGDLFESLAACPETFVVLNHPYWDLTGVGQMRHDSALLALMRAHHTRIHALELNGFRTWAENRLVLPLAKGFGIPVVGGGDRHGLAPNTIVNLTRATDLAAFAHELRVERASHCVVFPEYAQPHLARILQGVAETLRPHPRHHRGHSTWAERVYITINGVEHSVDSLWEREPLWLRGVLAMTRAVGSRRLEGFFELARRDGHETLEVDCQLDTLFDRVPTLSTDSAAA